MTMVARVLRFLRVPAAPSAPAGDHDVSVFRASPKYYRYRLLHWFNTNIGAGVGVYFGLRATSSVHMGGLIGVFIWLAEVVAVTGFVGQAIARLILLRIDIDQRWYLMSDRSLRIREGIVNLKEKTMTFANVQNVQIEQGPLQRFFGIADVQVRTAGGGASHAKTDKHDQSSDKDMHIAYFRGVDNAEAIRDAIRERLHRHRDSGLGDPDDVVTDAADPLMIAARALALEATALRASVAALR